MILTLAIALGLVTLTLLAVVFLAGRFVVRVDSERTTERLHVEREHTAERQAWIEQTRQERRDSKQESIDQVERLHATYDRLIARQADTFQAAVEKVMNLVNFGQPTRPAAVIEEREPDAHTRAARMIDEDTIAVGVNRLRAEYENISPSNVPTDDELYDEARMMLTGGQFRAGETARALLRD